MTMVTVRRSATATIITGTNRHKETPQTTPDRATMETVPQSATETITTETAPQSATETIITETVRQATFRETTYIPAMTTGRGHQSELKDPIRETQASDPATSPAITDRAIITNPAVTTDSDPAIIPLHVLRWSRRLTAPTVR